MKTQRIETKEFQNLHSDHGNAPLTYDPRIFETIEEAVKVGMSKAYYVSTTERAVIKHVLVEEVEA